MQVLHQVGYLIWICVGLHLIADFVLQIQGNLQKFKCQSWWDKQVNDRIGALNKLSQTIIDDIVNIADNEKRVAMAKKFTEYSSNVYEAKEGISKQRSGFIAGLMCHSIMWSVVTFVPLAFVVNASTFSVLMLVNTGVHAVVDHLKCNRECINLFTDQLIHLVQVVVTVYVCCNFFQ